MLCNRKKSFKRPCVQVMITDETKLRKYSKEKIVENITRAEDMRLNFSEIDESIIRKCLSRYFCKNFLVDLKNFELWYIMVKKHVNHNNRNTKKSKSDFFSNDQVCFTCHKKEYDAEIC